MLYHLGYREFRDLRGALLGYFTPTSSFSKSCEWRDEMGKMVCYITEVGEIRTPMGEMVGYIVQRGERYLEIRNTIGELVYEINLETGEVRTVSGALVGYLKKDESKMITQGNKVIPPQQKPGSGIYW